MRKVLTLLLPLLLCTTVSAQLTGNAPLSFHVTGEAQALPDTAIIHFTIAGEGETLAKAQEQAKQTERGVVGALEKSGLKNTPIQTDRFGAAPIQATVSASSAESGVFPLGYRVVRDCSVRIPVTADSLDRVLQIADAVLAQGTRPTASTSTTSYDGYRQPVLMEFMTTNPNKLQEQAMSDALARARSLAEAAAKQMGRTEVRLVSVHMSDSHTTPDIRNAMPSGERRDPIITPTWQPVKISVTIDTTFTY